MKATDEEWFANDDFWREMYPYMFTPGRFEEASGEVDSIIALAGFTKGRILDLCCGPGRHSVELAKRGYSVTGVDYSPFLLERARERSEGIDGPQPEFVREEMKSFVREGAYDLALSIFTSFGYYEDDEYNRTVLANVRQSLKDGGTFVLETMGKENLAKIFTSSNAEWSENGALLAYTRKIVADWTRIENVWTLISEGQVRSFDVKHWLYSGTELRSMMLEAGFHEVALYGALDGRPYDNNARRLVAVAR